MKSVIVGYYNVEGFGPDFSETTISGHGPTDYLKLDGETARKHPGKKFVRTGSRIESRDENDPGYLEYVPGQTLTQLFDGIDTPQLRVGTVVWQHDLCDVYLRIHRSKQTVGITLKSRGAESAVFSEQAKGDRLVQELPAIVRKTLGPDHRDLILRVLPKSA